MSAVLGDLIRLFDLFMVAYFGVLTIVTTAMAIVGWRAVEEYVRRRPLRDYGYVARSPLSLPVSILVPAYNEAPVIAASIRALIASQFVNLEVIVVNDGSTDDTMGQLRAAFGLVLTSRVPRDHLPTLPIRGIWVSPDEPRLVVIDKENGGKADSLNAALCYARYPLVCAIDADTMLDPAALSRLVWEFQVSPDTVATGGIVRVLNGSVVQDGRILQVRTPRRFIDNIQILEYLRAFLGARLGWSRLGMLLIISGAFGLFRREVVVAAGGYDTTTVGEDAELVLRLHRYHRERGLPCRITFFPDPICWTEAPGDLRTLVRQRDRWQRGLVEMLWRHRDMIGRRRFGRVGTLALPYFVVFELLGPLLELLGLVAIVATVVFGLASTELVILVALLSVTYGFVLSILAILMEERAFRRYPGWRCLARLLLAAVVENLGYRQLMMLVRIRALLTAHRSSGRWGEMPRVGFSGTLRPVPAVTV